MAQPEDDLIPTNIASATPEYVNRHVSDWDEEILELRRARLGLESEMVADGSRPLYLIDAERQAKMENTTVEAIIDRHKRQLRESTYPTPDCLLPDEVVEYLSKGHLPDTRAEHARACEPCATLLTAMKIEKFGDSNGTASPTMVAFARRKDTEETWRQRILAALSPASLGQWASITLTPIILLGVTYWISKSLDKEAAWLTAPHDTLPWVVIFAAPFFALLAHTALRSYVIRRALALGSIIGIVFMAFYYADLQQGRVAFAQLKQVQLNATNAQAQATNAQAQIVEDKMESVAVSSIQHKNATGKFLGPLHGATTEKLQSNESDSLAIRVEKMSAKEAVYVGTTSQSSWRVVADVRPDSADITWQDDNQVRKTIQLIVGTIEHSKHTGIENAETTLVVRGGSTYNFSNMNDTLLPDAGTSVLATVDPDTKSVTHIINVLYRQPRLLSTSFSPK